MIRLRVDVQSCTPDFIRMIQAPNIYAYSFCKEQGVVHDQNKTKQNKKGHYLRECPQFMPGRTRDEEGFETPPSSFVGRTKMDDTVVAREKRGKKKN